jgi:hypothetical protein
MPTTEKDKGAAGSEQPGSPERNALIGGHVLRILGQPPALYRLEVRRLWDDYYRVNVFVGPDAASASVAHSYFLATDKDGAVVASTPDITRRY